MQPESSVYSESIGPVVRSPRLSLAWATLWFELSCHSIAAPLTNLAFDFPKPLAHTHTRTQMETRRVILACAKYDNSDDTCTLLQLDINSQHTHTHTQRRRLKRRVSSANPHSTVDADPHVVLVPVPFGAFCA